MTMSTTTVAQGEEPVTREKKGGDTRDAAAVAAEAAAEHRRRYVDWTADPVVVVSKRPYIFAFPPALLRGEEPRWVPDPQRPHDKGGRPSEPLGTLRLRIGLNFVAARASCFLYADVPVPGPAPQAVPRDDDLHLVTLDNDQRTMLEAKYADVDAKAMDVQALLAAWGRVLTWLAHAPDDKTHRGTSPARFVAPASYHSPDVYVGTFSALMRSSTSADAAARATAENCIPYLKHQATLGAAHDYAVRAGALGSSLAQACRKRSQAFQVGGR